MFRARNEKIDCGWINEDSVREGCVAHKLKKKGDFAGSFFLPTRRRAYTFLFRTGGNWTLSASEQSNNVSCYTD